MDQDDEIFGLVCELDSLNTGKQAAERLVLLGRPSIEPLRRFLLEGRPCKIFHPRLWAAEALARLGAKEVLFEYLFQMKEIPDPEDKFGEEAVESAAARFLASWPTEDVYRALLKLSERRVLIGLIDALAEFKRPESIPYFEQALEDDFYRSASEEAFLKLGPAGCSALAKSAVTPRPNSLMESRSSLQRRRSAVKLLCRIGMVPERWAILRELLHDPDEEILVSIAKLGIGIGSKDDRPAIARRILTLLSSAPWYLQNDIENILIMLETEAASVIDQEISQRMKQPEDARAVDIRLRSLVRVRRRFKTKRKNDI